MSIVSIRAALETALNGMSPALATSWENAAFAPTAGVAYQQVNVLFAQPVNTEYGSTHREEGYMQVKLMYPLSVGTATIYARAELLRATFKRGNSFVNGGITVVVGATPEVAPGAVEGDRFAVPVKIPFYVNVM